MVDFFDFKVGTDEVHHVQYYNDYGGYYNVVRVDGEIISGWRIIPFLSKYPNLIKGDTMRFKVGKNEVHDIKITFDKGKGSFSFLNEANIMVEVDGKVFKTIKARNKSLI